MAVHARSTRSLCKGATGSLAASAVYTAQLTSERANDDQSALSMHRRAFLAGGVTHGVGYGLLVGAVGLTGRRTRLLSPALTDVALASAAAGLLVAPELREGGRRL